MLVRPNAKINLGLFITGKRPDGYHLLETVFLPIPLCDELEILPAPELPTDELEVLGEVATGPLEDNLVLRAVRALRTRYPFPSLRLRLSKHIPSGAGMGGGSADASFTLTAINELFALGASPEELEGLALGLGADCPFFVRNTPALARGIGEELSPLPLPHLSGLHLSIVKPALHSSTAEAFRGLGELRKPSTGVDELVRRPVSAWRGCVENDFERSLFPLYPELEELKAALYDLGADFALLTGSGAALYALSTRPLELDRLASPGRFLWQGILPTYRP